MKTLIILSVLVLASFFVSDLVNNTPNKLSEFLIEKIQKPILKDSFDTSQNSLKDSKNTIISPKDTKNENSLNLSTLFQKLLKSTQEFSISPNSDTILRCKEGTIFNISSNSFAFENNYKSITKNINLKVKEFYQISDFIVANLSTTTINDILETGGTIYIEAFSEGQKCKLKKDKTLEIRFPYKDKKEGMELFAGQFNNSNIIEWKKQINEEIKRDDVVNNFWRVEQKPEFIGGEAALFNYLAANTIYPAISKERGSQGRVFVQFQIDTTGKIINPEIINGVDPDIDKEAIRVIKSMPTWIPGKVDGKKVTVSYVIPISFRLDGFSSTAKSDYFENKKYFQTIEDSIESANTTDLNSYILYSTNLGWINCDRFVRSNKQKINYYVNSDENVNIKIVFNEYRSILQGSYYNNNSIFQNVPIGEKITIIALKCENNSPYIAIKQTIISNKPEKELVFEKVSLEALKAKIKILNNI